MKKLDVSLKKIEELILNGEVIFAKKNYDYRGHKFWIEDEDYINFQIWDFRKKKEVKDSAWIVKKELMGHLIYLSGQEYSYFNEN